MTDDDSPGVESRVVDPSWTAQTGELAGSGQQEAPEHRGVVGGVGDPGQGHPYRDRGQRIVLGQAEDFLRIMNVVGRHHLQQLRLGMGSGRATGTQFVEQTGETAADLEHLPRLDALR